MRQCELSDRYRRTMAAYCRAGAQDGIMPAQPSEALSGEVQMADGRQSVRLVNVNGVLAVYQIKSNGFL
jgi:hypothetical protein